jgi:periplasmic protein TonB
VKHLGLTLTCGILISLGLFWLMQLMLTSNPQAIKKSDSLNMMEFVRLKRDPPKPKPKKPPEKKALAIQGGKTEPRKQAQQSQKISKPQKAPIAKQIAPKEAAPKLDIPEKAMGSGPTVSQSGIPGGERNGNVIGGGKGSGTGSGNGGNGKGSGKGNGAGASSGLIALSRVQPKYPARAMSRRIEGWVRVEFTVTTTGAVRNAHVAAAEPSGIFDEAALNAISQYRFKPEVIDGVASERKGTQKFSFKLNK